MTEQLLQVGVERLRPDPAQPRRTFDPDYIQRLAVSIAQRGILQPLRVRPGEDDFFWIVLGENRWRAAKEAKEETVPCIVVAGADVSEIDILSDQITENELKASLRPLELARAISKLKALKKCNSRVLAEELGLSGAAITRAEALLTLPFDIQEMVDGNRLAESAAYEISRLDGEQAQRSLALAAEGGKLSREKIVEAVRAVIPKRNVVPRSSRVTAQLDRLSITVSGSEPLTWDGLLTGLDRLRKEAKKLCEGGKEISDLARLRAS